MYKEYKEPLGTDKTGAHVSYLMPRNYHDSRYSDAIRRYYVEFHIGETSGELCDRDVAFVAGDRLTRYAQLLANRTQQPVFVRATRYKFPGVVVSARDPVFTRTVRPEQPK